MALTGTPAHTSPLDVYAQYRFLDPGIFGANFSAFRDRYAVMGGYGGYQVVAYRVSPTLPDGQPNPYYSPKLDQEFQEMRTAPPTCSRSTPASRSCWQTY